MYIFMPVLWLPGVFYFGWHDAPFYAIVWTLFCGRMETWVQQFVEWARVTDIEAWAVDSMKTWEAYVIYRAETDQAVGEARMQIYERMPR
jgi:hypothetical protein